MNEQAESGLPVTAFCHQACISQASFYRWQGRLCKGLPETGGNVDRKPFNIVPAFTTPQSIPDFVDWARWKTCPLRPDGKQTLCINWDSVWIWAAA
ncbi:IS66 family insertion sequence element accessory protein TnpA [Acidithiobacillus marinus]|uniref:IS66 family insertion sequence element accessory protein TnpA n=1 Tax=Acidithiobacillus marinus TaxID=187490 RepID=UPI003F5F77CA